MDFLKEIVKEVGGEYTQLAADINDSETYVDTVRTFLTDSFQAVFLVVYLGIRLLPLLGSLLLAKLSYSSLKISLIAILMVLSIFRH